ncbi:hypothetical protein U2F26_13715 [Micromonospora sp. 4G57]|uniref:Uncharacterized protein n=1 Tax=Micromonospora sicca TaxID=2202420 RepID=A0ABU5JAU9_9ACTN|nr:MULTISPECIES: hypothetical protein [unclassified Micromonospora]MDZ5443781.1 hypothetical protein [Micromonospora sp. 4G57]MDZ5489701.1 hypothetical protein [Micromonospora sp. 4G53]
MTARSKILNAVQSGILWGLPIALTALAVAWTLVAVGGLLATQAPAWVAYSAGGLFDLVWVSAMLHERAHRRSASVSRTPTLLGWVLLAVSVAAVLVHGLAATTVPIAVIGAVIPVLGKLTLQMAMSTASVRITPDAQRKVDMVRSRGRDAVAVARAVDEVKAVGEAVGAEHTAREYRSRVKAHAEVDDARRAYESALKDQAADIAGAAPVSALPSFGLISDDDIRTLLDSLTVPSITAGGTPSGTVVAQAEDGYGTPDDKALQLLAAEVYTAAEVDENPPSLREFRRRMREALTARRWKASTALVDQLYRHEKTLRTGPEGAK